jgi:hypothetical protein
MLTHEDIVTYIRENYPEAGKTTVAFDSVEQGLDEVATRLFLDGYNIIAANEVAEAIDAFNRQIYNMSGSLFRYRFAPFSNIYKEPATVLITAYSGKGDSQYAKEVIDVNSGAKPKADLEPVTTVKETKELPPVSKRGPKPKAKS